MIKLNRYECPDPNCQAGVELHRDGNLWRIALHTVANADARTCPQSYHVAQVVHSYTPAVASRDWKCLNCGEDGDHPYHRESWT